MSANEVVSLSKAILISAWILMMIPVIEIMVGFVRFRTMFLCFLGMGLSLFPILLMKVANVYDSHLAFGSYALVAGYFVLFLVVLIWICLD